MVVTKLNISFVIDEEEACEYTLEGSTMNPPYDNIEIMIRRKKAKAPKRGKIKVGERYMNNHTGKVCEVLTTSFYNIGYLEDGEPRDMYPHYRHYLTFECHWTREEDNEHEY